MEFCKIPKTSKVWQLGCITELHLKKSLFSFDKLPENFISF